MPDPLVAYDAAVVGVRLALAEAAEACEAEDKERLIRALGAACTQMAEITELLKGASPARLQ